MAEPGPSMMRRGAAQVDPLAPPWLEADAGQSAFPCPVSACNTQSSTRPGDTGGVRRSNLQLTDACSAIAFGIVESTYVSVSQHHSNHRAERISRTALQRGVQKGAAAHLRKLPMCVDRTSLDLDFNCPGEPVYCSGREDSSMRGACLCCIATRDREAVGGFSSESVGG